ncbi:sensor histidine kinase [Streptomyces sp. S.PNR 29]|uniref:sensor histidine kinase n=1 Tax=Streptomyces sp. S.PNR 29 TaxID=2973805 RepID=UPI0025B26DB2|nr:sensor histidine kinase [Streptomyces sp. S.PNR 29]MDN0200514.1 sensor histidine kinase [Streptomyces sp. S.PNR 29]
MSKRPRDSASLGLDRRYAERIEEFQGRHPHAVDLVIVLALMGCAALGSSLTMPGADPPDHERAATALMGVSCLALLKHRTHVRMAVAVTAVCTVAAVALGYLVTPLLLAPVMAALYWLAAQSDRTTTRAYGLTTMAAVTLAAVFSDSMGHLSMLLRTIGPVFWLLMPLAAGKMTQLRHAYLQSVQARAEHAERTREEEARLRVTEERMRIARELHDVVAHHLALANAQAGTAAHLARSSPAQAQKILDDLTGTTSSALRELKATVGVLRRPNDPDAASLEPSPGLGRLPELVSACESAGLKVTVTTEGEPRPLSPGVDLTAFRIVQEALTNVTKHAAAQTAHIRLAYSGNRLTISVTDNGSATAAATPPPGPDRGFGLMGMRERAQSVGGCLSAGHRPEGGFEVTTALPLHSHAPEEGTTP